MPALRRQVIAWPILLLPAAGWAGNSPFQAMSPLTEEWIGPEQDEDLPLPVTGGEEAPEQAWPEVTALLHDGDFRCAGTLIAPRLVLTADHCLWGGDL